MFQGMKYVYEVYKEKSFSKSLDSSPLFGYNNDRCICGCSSMVESQPSKLVVWVRFPSPAPARDAQFALVAQVDRATAF